MAESLQLILFFTSIIAGVIVIFFSLQLMKQHKDAEVSSYFYYLIFIYIFGTYSLIGSGVLEWLFLRMETETNTIRSAKLFTIFLGIPFLGLAKFMLLRSVLEFFRKKIIPAFTIPYFLISIIAFVLYGFFTVKLSRLNQVNYQLVLSVQRWVFIGFEAIMYLLILVLSFLQSKKIEAYRRKFIRRFGLLYTLYMLLTCSTFALYSKHSLIPFVFIFIFLSWHLIPILLYNTYLNKYQSRTAPVEDNFETLLSVFVTKYEISKREREVVYLICRGLSNQEIGESLYISLQTVKDHIHHIFVKTGVKNRVQLSNLIRSG